MGDPVEALSLEERATNYETMRHIRRVGHFLHRLVKELLDRAEAHDQSKLAPPEVGLFTEFTPKLAGSTYGSPEYEGFRKALAPALEHHYRHNRHHPEYARRDEEWRPVNGFERCYEVSNYGNLRSLDRLVKRSGPTGDLTKKGKALTQTVTPKGYCRVQLRATGRRRNLMVHVVVAEAFIPNPEGKPTVNHKDGDKRNNRVSNLEWASHSEQLRHAYKEKIRLSSVRYAVTCESLGLTTLGYTAMEKELKKLGYAKADASGVWNASNHGVKHLGMDFTAARLATWANSPVNDMNLLDVLEMLCDWKAATERHHDGNITSSIDKNRERFGLSPQLAAVLHNTVSLLGD